MEWVLFDYGQVISRAQPAGAMGAMAAAAAADPVAFERAYWQHRDDYDGAGHTPHSYWANVADSRADPVDEALAAALDDLDIASWLTPDAGTVAVIHELEAAKIPLALLSNAPLTHAAAIAAQEWMRAFAGHTFFSARLAMTKPSPAIFRHVVAELGVRAQDVIFIDDRDDNIAAAAALGIRTIPFRGATDLRAQLASFGVL